VIESNARVAHIGVAVSDLEAALAIYRDILGLKPSQPVTADGASIVSIKLDEIEVELMEPISPDSPVAKFIERRGPGIHHICYRVSNLDGTLDECRRLGFQLIDDSPRPGAEGRRVAFIHPKAAGGILLELTE